MRRLLLVAFAVTILAACRGGSDSSSPTGTVAPAALSSPPAPILWGGQPLADGQSRFEVDHQFASKDFIVRIGSGIYDARTTTVYLGVSAQDIVSAKSDLSPSFALTSGAAPINGSFLDRGVLSAPTGMLITFTMRFDKVVGFDPATTMLLVGDPKKPERTVPLHADPAFAATADLPAALPLDTWTSQGKYTFHFTDARLTSERYHAQGPTEQALEGNRIIELTYDVWTISKDTFAGFFPDDHVHLKRPDGVVAPGKAATTGDTPYSYSAFGPERVRFPVDPSVAGAYTLIVNGHSSGFVDNSHVNLATTETPITLPAPAIVEPLPGPMPEPARPVVAADPKSSTTTTTAPLPAGQTQPLDVTFAFGGLVLHLDKLVTDPAKGKVVVSGKADTIAVQPPPERGLLATDNLGVEARGTTFLTWDGHWLAGRLTSKGTIPWGGAPLELSFDAAFAAPRTGEIDSRVQLDRASLVLVPGSPKQGGLPAVYTAPIGPDATLPRSATPTGAPTFKIDGAPIVTGQWTTHLVSGRLGPVRAAFSPPAGWTTLELTLAAALDPAASEADFLVAGNVFLARPDGYVTPVRDIIRVDKSGTLAKGESGTYVVQFDLPPERIGTRMAIIVRSKDEASNVFDKDKGWVEGNLAFSIPADLVPAATAAPAPAAPTNLGG